MEVTFYFFFSFLRSSLALAGIMTLFSHKALADGLFGGGNLASRSTFNCVT